VRGRVWALLLGPILVPLVAVMPVSADCDPAGPLEEALPNAPVAFVGTAVEVVRSMARFEIHEVWAGAVANGVEVHGMTSGVEFGEDDRRWEAGTKYLVVPFIEGQVLRDSICTATTEWSAEMELLRPEDARVISAEPADGAAINPALVLAGLVILVLAGASAIAFRRR
jgi:hypothetical protein